MTQTTARPTREKSTIDRFFSVPGWIRTSFRLLDQAAPAVGARWAERIWFTLPKGSRRSGPPSPGGPSGPETGATPPSGRAFAVDLDGARVVGEAWGEGPPVYLLHGWAGNRGQMTGVVAGLVERGHRVVAFDAPSHGDSGPGAFGPRSSSILEFAAALNRVVGQYGPPYAIVAHSMGSTATAVALCDGMRAGRVVMLAPMASPLSYARQFATALGFGERTLHRLVARVERRVGAPMRHFDAPELGRAVAMPPTLIVHDRYDRTAPVSDGAAIAAAWPSARLHVTSGLGHRRLLRDPDVIAEVVEFVTA